MSGKDSAVESTNLLRAYRFNQLEQSRLRVRLTTLERDRIRTERLNGYDIRKISSTIDFIQSSTGSSPEGLPPGSAYRQMNSSTTTMYGDHVTLQPGSFSRQRALLARPDKRGSAGHIGRRRVNVRAATAGVERVERRPQSTSGRPSTGAFSSSWIPRDKSDSESESDSSTVYDSGSETSGATEDHKQTTAGGRSAAWADPAASRQPRAPARCRDYLRKGGKSAEAQQMAESDIRRRDSLRKKLMEINEERRKAITQRLSNFWAHYPVPGWHPH